MQKKRSDGIDLVARSRSRRRALQALYAWQISGNPMSDVIEHFRQEQEMEIADIGYFEDLLRGVEKHHDKLSTSLQSYLDREVLSLDAIARSVLLIAAYELLHRPDVPYRVVINEAIEVTKRFGAEQEHSYINGVLDKAAADWRTAEYRSVRC